jgi:hypothetical protein
MGTRGAYGTGVPFDPIPGERIRRGEHDGADEEADHAKTDQAGNITASLSLTERARREVRSRGAQYRQLDELDQPEPMRQIEFSR